MTELPDNIVSQLRATQSRAAEHPDANVLAAFANHSLCGRDRATVFAHLAQCPDCREVVALAGIPETRKPAKTGWWWSIRLAAPVAAACLIVTAVWLRRPETQFARATHVTQVPPAQPPVVVAHELRTPVPEERHPQPLRTSRPARAKPPARAESGLGGFGANTAERAAAPAVAPPIPLSAGSRQFETVQRVPSLARPQLFVRAAPKPVPSNPAPFTLSFGSPGKVEPAAALPRLQLEPMWSLGIPATVNGTANAVTADQLCRSFDGGRTWGPVALDPDAHPTALLATGRDVWVGGTEARLWHSIDGGAHWTRIEIQSDEPIYGAITQIKSPTAGAIDVSIQGFGVWQSTDNGASWEKLQQ